MGKNGQAAPTPEVPYTGTGITDVAYRPSLSSPLGMDVLDFSELLRRGRRRGIDLASPQRPGFHHLLHVRSGGLRHRVDFTDHVLRPGDWLWVRPGQVHQYAPDDLAAAHGVIVIWQPGFVAVEPPPRQEPVRPAGPHARGVPLALRHLVHEYGDLGAVPLEVHIEALRMLLNVLLLRLAHVGREPAPAESSGSAFAVYRAAVEQDFYHSHRVADYAAALGWSTRTLTRACLAATGRTAKQYLDGRVLLEAKRLLVHTGLTSAEVGRELGFADPGDFGKFFRARDGRTPMEFRRAARGTSGA
ncbi:helix-turn-helix domain-containing protein [Streptomyces sp. NPDC048305]|uniref:helix-turn-helix domain-containing protein n=1 Tax=Streptomyces sp. NPDC048305 TaxID=3365532 RepID=UPI00371D91DA